MNSIFQSIFSKQAGVLLLLNLVAALVFVLYMKLFGTLISRYTAYFFVAPFVLMLLFQWKDSAYKVAAPLFVLIFIEATVISRIPVISVQTAGEPMVFFKLGITFIFGLVVLASFMYYNEKLEMPTYMPAQWMLFLLTAIISMIIGGNGELGLLAGNTNDFITYYLTFFLFFYLGYRAFKDPEKIKKFLFLLMIFGALTAVAHLFAITTGTNLESVRGEEAIGEGRDLSEGNWRYGGFFGNVNTMSAFYVMLIPASLYLIFSDQSIMKKITAALSITLMVVSMLLGASRGGLLWAFLGIIISLFYVKFSWRKIIIGIIFVAVVAIVANELLSQFLMEYLQRSIEEMTNKGTDSPRQMIWHYTIFIIRDNPLGIGLSGYNFSTKLMEYGQLDWNNPHNMYLEMLTQTGYAGFILFLSIAGRVMFNNVKAIRNSDNIETRQALVFLLLVISGFMMMGLTEPVFRNQYKLNYTFATLLGISLALSRRVIKGRTFEKNIENTDNTIQKEPTEYFELIQK